MSNSSLVCYTKISPNRTKNRNHTIDTISIHCYVGQVDVKRGCDLFSNPLKRASCNYVVAKDGKIGMVVEEKDRSWCTSNKANDHRAITIEVACDTYAPYRVNVEAMNALIELCTDICKRNNINKLVWSISKSDRVNHKNGCNMTVHRDYAKKSCPGDYLYGKHSYIADEVNKRLGYIIVNKPIQQQTSTAINNSTYNKTRFIKDIQSAIGAKVDGIAGAETLSKTITVSKSKNRKHAVVKPIQKYLNFLGYNCGNADGVAGAKFDAAVKAYQKSHKCVTDGEITARGKTWKYLLGSM